MKITKLSVKIMKGFACAAMAILGIWAAGLMSSSSPEEWVEVCSITSAFLWVTFWAMLAVAVAVEE